MISVFYDGKCGLCRRQIKYYEGIAPAGIFEWIDITQTPEPFTTLGFKVNDGLRVLHVRDSKGKMHLGIDALIVIWRLLTYWRVLAIIVSLPIIKSTASWLYIRFANWRYKRLGYDSCDI